MAEKYKRPKQFSIRCAVPPETNSEVDAWALKTGMTKAQFGGLIVQLGLKAFIRSYSPEDLLSPEAWSQIMKGIEDAKKAE